MSETPEQKARREIDAKLLASGWLVQDRADLDLTAGHGIAIREFPMKSGFGFADYLLYLDQKAVGAIEAKAEGTLAGVEAQSAECISLEEWSSRPRFRILYCSNIECSNALNFCFAKIWWGGGNRIS